MKQHKTTVERPRTLGTVEVRAEMIEALRDCLANAFDHYNLTAKKTLGNAHRPNLPETVLGIAAFQNYITVSWKGRSLQSAFPGEDAK